MKKLLILSLLSFNAYALEFEFGVKYMLDPFYSNLNAATHPDIVNEKLAGSIALTHTFKLSERWGIRIGAEHESLLLYQEPAIKHDVISEKGRAIGRNSVSTDLVFKIF